MYFNNNVEMMKLLIFLSAWQWQQSSGSFLNHLVLHPKKMNHSDLVLVGYNKGHVETSLRICGKERLMEAVELAEVMSSGSLNAWDPREIRSALHFYDFNITAAVQALHDEEVLLEHEFQEAVESMVLCNGAMLNMTIFVN